MTEKVSDSAAAPVDSPAPAGDAPPTRLALALDDAFTEAHDALALRDPEAAVHGVRKGFKRLRALLRLAEAARARAVSQRARAARRALAQTARHLAQARDAAAREDALDDLVAKAGLAKATRRAAGRALASTDAPVPQGDGVGAHRAALEAEMAALAEALPRLGAALDDGALCAALAASYAKARRAGRAVDPQDDESLHELRKDVIAQRYQMELVVADWPGLGQFWVDELQRLRDKLGKHHDLAVLRTLVEAHPARAGRRPAWCAPLLAAIAARQGKLAHTALLLHARLFAEKPKAFRRRLSAYMSAVSERK
ncbi:CHAD domain-containing protein [Ancylobacter polymorphus]|uniref:CHAD domain-containing protein n=1 Tax=Ancylobacter polymorphus TaxID=223390 RepID=A0A9E6ZVV0_9HYPH|nr:CHAD domain-containing protein [Ancylobacter polymorphus]UOK72659.1 CHAD domain-containing protein [Ancylobacter polymorphus]